MCRIFLTAGGTKAELDALNLVVKADARKSAAYPALGEVERLAARYAAQMKLDEHFDTTQLVELTRDLRLTKWWRGFWLRWV